MPPRTAAALRDAFCEFFVARGHTPVPSASLIPHDPTVLFTVAGMVPFKPYFVGDEQPKFRRAVSVQKCVHAGGKHNDLDDIGRTNRHFSFFEMLGNFSFGDYFKAEAIPWAWEFVTEVLELDPERLWVTVHHSDDEAAAIWRDAVGVAPDRIQRLGEDNFWRMADTGPCGPCSEIFWDLGPEFGADGGPEHGSDDRFVEIWNLVFMQFDQQADGTQALLPKPSIDTGAGLERILAIVQGLPTAWDTECFQPLIAEASRVTGVEYNTFPGTANDVSLRILADHARAMTFLAADGVVPSNEERGYVLRRIIRRAVRHAFLLGANDLVTPALVAATVEQMGKAYPEIVRQHDLVMRAVRREEERFRQTLERGLDLLDGMLDGGDVSGADAFYLHDTLGFPIDLTREIAEERGRAVDLDGFRDHMAKQRTRAQEAHKAAGGRTGEPLELYRELLEELGPTTFTGRQEQVTDGAKVRALITSGERVGRAATGRVDVVLDRTPFYAESGGQVGDTGMLTAPGGATVRVLDTQYGLPGLVVHRAEIVEGEIADGDEVIAAIDAVRRDRIRRNHTATHLLHWALREVLGPHVQQAGSHVSPERLRFDFSHFEAVTPEQLDRVESLANGEVISDAPVRHYETTREHAESLGAIAFFGEKYGDLVRVLEAGEHSLELCGGTHVHALGFIGPVKIVSEGSIGANLRRIEAVTGDVALERIRDEEATLRAASALLRVQPGEITDRLRAVLAELRETSAELDAARARDTVQVGRELAAAAADGVVAERRDGLASDALRALAVAARDALHSGVVALVGAAPGGKAGLVVALTADLVSGGASAAEIAGPAARILGGGVARNAELVVGGGPAVDRVDEALEAVRTRAEEAVRSAGAGT